MSTGDISTLEEARAYIEARVRRGVDCPCCGQFCRLYRRALDKQMGAFLIDLVRLQKGLQWVSIRAIAGNDKKDSRHAGGQLAKMAHWGLIKKKENTSSRLRTSGYWRATQRGIRFSKGKSKVPSHAFVYNNQLVGFSNRPVDISDVLTERFHYQRMMMDYSGAILPMMVVN